MLCNDGGITRVDISQLFFSQTLNDSKVGGSMGCFHEKSYSQRCEVGLVLRAEGGMRTSGGLMCV